MFFFIAFLIAFAFAQVGAMHTIVVQPAWFGKSWGNTTVDATVWVVDHHVDLCNETLLETTTTTTAVSSSMRIDPSNNNNNNMTTSSYHTALLFDAVEKGSECPFPTMAQVAETLFPFADMLLISRLDFLGLAQEPGQPDTSLRMATISLEDTQAIKRSWSRMNNNTTKNDTGLLVTIDGVSRSLVDFCNCKEDDTDDPLVFWTWALRISSTLSILGSSYIIWSLASTQKKRSENLKLLFNRLLIALCVCDIISSVCMFIGRWAYASKPPGDYQGYFSEELWLSQRPGALGTKTTCAAQGFVIHLGMIGVSIFTCFLAIQTLLYVKHGWRSEQMKKAEIAFFTIGIGVPLIGACIALHMNLFNEFDLGFCWLTKPVKRCEYVVKDVS